MIGKVVGKHVNTDACWQTCPNMIRKRWVGAVIMIVDWQFWNASKNDTKTSWWHNMRRFHHTRVVNMTGVRDGSKLVPGYYVLFIAARPIEYSTSQRLLYYHRHAWRTMSGAISEWPNAQNSCIAARSRSLKGLAPRRPPIMRAHDARRLSR